MSDLRVELVEVGVAPGGAIQGRVMWDRRELHPKQVEVPLGWHTAGAGDKDESAPLVERFEIGAGVGEIEFSFRAPDGPYSFSGKLLSIVWTVEAVVGTQSVRVPVVIGPGGRELVVGRVAS